MNKVPQSVSFIIPKNKVRNKSFNFILRYYHQKVFILLISQFYDSPKWRYFDHLAQDELSYYEMCHLLVSYQWYLQWYIIFKKTIVFWTTWIPIIIKILCSISETPNDMLTESRLFLLLLLFFYYYFSRFMLLIIEYTHKCVINLSNRTKTKPYNKVISDQQTNH